MKSFSSCSEAIQECLRSQKFTVAYLCSEEKTMDIHIHDCFEIYYSLSGGRQFLIGDQCYDVAPGDLFVINNYESHYLSWVESRHERIVISIAPEYLSACSTEATDLKGCFTLRSPKYSHRLRLTQEERDQLLYLTHKITSSQGFGADVIEGSAFLELMVLVNRKYLSQEGSLEKQESYQHNEVVAKVIDYMNSRITEKLTIGEVASHFYLSEGYLSRLFKSETGTTINKYLTARRISIAKAKLTAGCSVSDACEQSGFNDYTNFVQAFTKMVGITPKKYGKMSNR